MNTTANDPIVVIGAGPCGLACARELVAQGRDVVVLEQAATPGGCGSSDLDAAGFTWDRGCHVVFSHYGEFDRLLTEVMGDDLLWHDRSSYIRFADRWVPYPFQNNLHRLPPEVGYECLTGLLAAPGGEVDSDFGTWMRAVFGDGITRHFMRPYNFKVWAHPAEQMSARWIGERVSVVDAARALRTVVFREDDLAWGPNNRFGFPYSGGTGELYRRIAERLGDVIRYRHRVERVDPVARTVHTDRGLRLRYSALVSTAPLPQLVASLTSAPDEVRGAAARLRSNGVLVVGIGYEQPLADDRSWFYFPDQDVPFYRVTNFAKYAAANVPGSRIDRYSAYLTETSYSVHKPVDRGSIVEQVEQGLRRSGLVDGQPRVVSTHLRDLPVAYPVPTRDRDDALAVVQPWLMARNIYSRGRFGSWRYEIGNMDHAVKMGIDIARHLTSGAPEPVFG